MGERACFWGHFCFPQTGFPAELGVKSWTQYSLYLRYRPWFFLKRGAVRFCSYQLALRFYPKKKTKAARVCEHVQAFLSSIISKKCTNPSFIFIHGIHISLLNLARNRSAVIGLSTWQIVWPFTKYIATGRSNHLLMNCPLCLRIND